MGAMTLISFLTLWLNFMPVNPPEGKVIIQVTEIDGKWQFYTGEGVNECFVLEHFQKVYCKPKTKTTEP